jgi:hypothetical protein
MNSTAMTHRITNHALAILGIGILVWHASAIAALAETRYVVAIDPSAERIQVDLPLVTRAGGVAYRFRCLGGSTRYLETVSAATKLNFVPPLTCFLDTPQESKAWAEGSLLSEDGSPPWHTRGFFNWQDLVGACGAYPEFGRVRHFRMRGFELTLEADEVEPSGESVRPFLFKISVRNDPTARTPVAERPRYLHPRGNCETIKRGVEPRMCRGSSGRWETCRGK